MMARALWITGPGRCEIRAEDLPAPTGEETSLRMLASGISRGTEALVFHGRVPPSQYQTMRAPLMKGAFPAPVKYGYAAVAATAAGARVFVLHPHQDVFSAPRAMCVPLPEDLPTHRAVLAANMETALNIVWDAAPLPGERVLVIGAGVVGLLASSLLARVPGCVVTLVDPDPARAALADVFGCGFCLPGEAPGDQDLLVHASGTQAGLRLALERAAFEARIIEASWFGDAEIALPLGESFHSRRLRLVASQVGAVAPAMRGRRSHGERLALALGLLRDARYDVLLQSVTDFDRLAERYAQILEGGLCHIVVY